MLHAQVCALERLHTLTLVACPKTAPRRQGLPLRAYVPRSCVCTSVPTHLESRSISEDSATTAGFGPAQMPGAGAPHLYSRSTSKTVPRCERVFHARVCDLQRTHLSVLAARQRPRHEVPPDLRCPAKRRMSPARGGTVRRCKRGSLPPSVRVALRTGMLTCGRGPRASAFNQREGGEQGSTAAPCVFC